MRIRFTGQTDWLRELQGMLFALMVISVAGGVFSVVATLAGLPFDVGVQSDVLVDDSLRDVRSGVELSPDASVYLQVSDGSAIQRALATTTTLPSYALTTTVLVLLWRLVGAARRTDTFTPATAGRLRTLGWLLIVGGPFVWLVEFVARFALTDTVTTTGASASLDFRVPLTWFFGGFILLAVGEVVRRGQALRAELDEVV